MIIRAIGIVCLMFVAATISFAGDEVFQLKARVGFTGGEDKIVRYHFIDEGRKLVIIGLRNLQIWDVENAKIVTQVQHQIPQFAPRGFVSTYFLLGLPKVLNWREYVIDPRGRWIITAEKTGQEVDRSAVVRDLASLKTIATIKMRDSSIEYLALDAVTGNLLTYGDKEKTASFGIYETEKFSPVEIISIPDYKWHQKLGDGKKMLVGTGDTKVVWTAINSKQGNSLTLRDVRTGAVEKEYKVEGVKPDSAFVDTIVSADEKHLIAKREGRVIVWEINGDGKPVFEVAKPTPKSEFDIETIHKARFIVLFADHDLHVYDIAKGGKRVLNVVRATPKDDLDFTSIVSDRFAVVRVRAKVHIYDLETGALRLEVRSDNDPKDRVEFRDISKDERLFAFADDDRVAVYNIDGDGKPVFEVRRESPKERFWAAKFFDERGLIGIARLNNSEKKPPRTEFYDVRNGKLEFTAPIEIYGNARFTPDNNLLYQVRLGAVDVWNAATGRSYLQPLETYTEETTDPSTGQTTQGDSYNYDDVVFSPDLKFFIKSARKSTIVYETATGRQLQILSQPIDDADLKKKKRAGKLGTVGWAVDGKLLFAEEPLRLFGEQRTLTLWDLKK